MKYAVIQYNLGDIQDKSSEFEKITAYGKRGWIVSMMHSDKKEAKKTFKYMRSNVSPESNIKLKFKEFKDDELIIRIRFGEKEILKVSGILADEMNFAENGGDGVKFFLGTDKNGINYFEG